MSEPSSEAIHAAFLLLWGKPPEMATGDGVAVLCARDDDRWQEIRATLQAAYAIDLASLTAERNRLQCGVLAAADELIHAPMNDHIAEAYHQLYAAIDPTFSVQGCPFDALRRALAVGEPKND